MPELSSLLNETKRPQVVADLTTLAEDTINSQSGLTGIALKGGIAAAKKVDSEIVPKGLNRMLPDALGELQPYWTEYRAGEQTGFGAFMATRGEEVTNSLLAVADREAEKQPSAAVKVYQSLRGKASSIITPALPAAGDIIEKHMN